METVGSSTRTLSYSYDDASRAVTLTLPDGKTVVRSMDVRGRLARVDLDGGKAVAYKYSMNQLTSDTLGNGIIRSYGYSFGRLDSLRHEKDGSLVSGHRLGWDSYGYLDWDRRSPVLNMSEHYGQDKEGQLKEWLQGTDNDGNGTIDALVDSLGWTLDSLGNWKAVYDSKVAIDTRTHNGVNEILTRNGQPFTYDEVGNLTSDGSKSYDWTLDGLLAKVALSDGRSVEYAYDAMRRLVKRTEKDSYGAVMETDSYLWEGWQLLQEERSGTASPETRTYAVASYPDDMVAMKVDGGSTPGTYYFHRNMTYTTEVVTDASGNVVERYKLTNPYGKWVAMDEDGTVRSSSAIGMRSVFQGSTLQDPLTSMSYFRNRWATEYGTWASRDPAEADANLYRMMGNSVEMVDPRGLWSLDIGAEWVKGFSIQTGFDKKPCKLCDKSKNSWKWWFAASGSVGGSMGLTMDYLGSMSAGANKASYGSRVEISKDCQGNITGGGCSEVSGFAGLFAKINIMASFFSLEESFGSKVRMIACAKPQTNGPGFDLTVKFCYDSDLGFRAGQFGKTLDSRGLNRDNCTQEFPISFGGMGD